MDIRFVQGFVDEIQRQKLAAKARAGQAVIPTGLDPGDRRMDQVEYQRGITYQAQPAPAQPSPLDAALGVPSFGRAQAAELPPLKAYGPTGAGPSGMIGQPGGIPVPTMFAIEQEAATTVPTAPVATDEVQTTSTGNVIPPYVDPQAADMPLAQSGEASFATQQRTRNTVAQHTGARVGAELGEITTESGAAATRLDENADARDALWITMNEHPDAVTPEQQAELYRIDEAIAADQATIDANRRRAGELQGGIIGSSLVTGIIMPILNAPSEWVQGHVGDLGYWYAAQAGDPGAAAAAIGFIANSPLGSILAADGVGASDYIRWIEEHPDEVAYVQQNGYTNANDQHFTGGEALYQYYLSSLNLGQQVVTGVITDPYSATGLAAGAGRMAARWGVRAAGALPEGSIAAAAARGAGRVAEVALSTPYNILDRAADVAVEGGLGVGRRVLRGGGGTIRDRLFIGAVDRPNSWSDVPLTAQAANVTEDADAALRQRAIAQEQLEGQGGFGRPGRPGPIDPNDGGGLPTAQAAPTPQPPPTSPNAPPPSTAALTPEDELPPPEEPDLTEAPTYTVYTRPEDIPTEVQSATETIYDPGAGEEIVVKRGGKKKDGTYNYRVEIDGVLSEGPTTREKADRYARGYVMQHQPTIGYPETGPFDPNAPRDPSVIPDEEVYTRVVFEDGSSAAYLDDDIVNGQPVDGAIPIATAAPDEDIADVLREDIVPEGALTAPITPFEADLFHGSPRTDLTTIQATSPEGGRQFAGLGSTELGASFTPDTVQANYYANAGTGTGQVYPVRIRLERPYDMDMDELATYQNARTDPMSPSTERERRLAQYRRAELEAEGYDGIVVRDAAGEVVEVISFRDVPVGAVPTGRVSEGPPTTLPAVERGIAQDTGDGFVYEPVVLPDGSRAVYIGRSTDDMPVRIVEGRDGRFRVERAWPVKDGGWEWKVTDAPLLRGIVGGDPEDYIGAAKSVFGDVDRIRDQARTGGGLFYGQFDPVPVNVTDDIARAQREIDLTRDESGPDYDMDVPAAERPPVDDLFEGLAQSQRGVPERAMLDAQEASGGGVYSFVLEHVGDLTNRMSQRTLRSTRGYEYVLNKVNKSLDTLQSRYGFAREHAENLRGNRRNPADVSAAGQRYADAHRDLTVYNDAQRNARDAAVALGEQRFDDAIRHLEEMKRHLGSEEEWVRYAGAYDDPTPIRPMAPDDPADFRAPGYRADDPGYDSVMEKHTEYLLDHFTDYYTPRGRAEDVWRYMLWDERDRRAMLKVRGKRATTPLLQSVTDRAHAQIKWAEMVPGEPLPPQGTRALDMTPEEIKAARNNASFSQMAELAMFGDDLQATAAREWMRRQPKKKISTERAILDLQYDIPVTNYKEAADYLKYLRAKRDAAVEAGMQVNRTAQRPLGATGAISDEMNFILNEIPRMRGAAQGRRLFSRLRRARLDRKKLEAIERNRKPLPAGDVTRTPIISDEAQRLINTRIADLGTFGRADTYDKARGVIVPRKKDAGDTARIVDVYDPIYNAARQAGSTIDEAHETAMIAVARRISEDFGQNPTSWLGRAADNLSAWHSQVSRYGDPVKTTRSIFGDLVGDAMQMALREGPVTSAKMVTMMGGAARRSRGWADTRAGEIVSEWGRDPNGFFSGQNLVKAEQAGGSGGRSGARTMLDPQWLKMGKVDLRKVNPGRGYAAGMDWMRGVNDKMEMLRRSGARIFLYDQGMTREARDFHLKVMQHRKLAQRSGVTPDDIKATVASLGHRFSPEDVRLAMERLAKARGATTKDAANFGLASGRGWANIDNRIFKQSKERVNRALFSYQYSNFDTRVRRVIPFHYWATRAIPFYLETAIRNPALGMAYYEMVKGLKERSEAEGWPDSLRFLVDIWTGPMGYIFFIDPVANLGLIGLTDMLFPYNDGDESKSAFGRFLDMATGRSGLGIMPYLTWPAAMAGMMGDDAFALDPTGTYATQELFRAVINVASAHGWWSGAEPTVYPNLVQDALVRGREVTSGLAEGRVPFAREIEATDPMAYTNLQIRNGMVDLLMQEKGYDNISQMTPEDWEIINTQYTTREGNLYTDALANWADANFLDRTVGGIFVGRSPIRQEGMLERQINQEGDTGAGGARRSDPRGGPGQPEPGQEPTQLQAYETTANLNGKYGRTQGGISLPEYDPYADYQLTPGEVQFMELWYQETGERYQEGDLEEMRERTSMNETMARTTPEAAPYVEAEIGYYNLGPEGDGDLINEYWNIVFADPSIGSTFIGDQEYTYEQVKNMSDDERGQLADAWMADRDTTGSARRTMQQRETWLDAHPEYAAYRDWAKEIRDSYEGNIGAYRNDVISGNANMARYMEDQARLAREEVGPNASPEAYYAELDQRTLNLGAYLALNGIQRNIGDPRPDSVGTPGPAPGPYDPRPAGWAPPTDESGSGGSGGGTGRTGSGGTDRSRTDWATATIAETESGVAQANALLTQMMGYPVDIMDLPPPVRDAAMAQLPPGLIPEDAWLYFDFRAWQAHQELNNAPTDLGSYLAATANGRDWKATRSTFSAGGATLVGGTPAQVYRGGGTNSEQDQIPANPYLNPYSNYFASGS